MKILDDLAGKIPGATEMQVRDALRLALQASVAGAATWLAMEAIGMNERFVGILSACLVMKATLGSTLVAGIQRVIATVVGCLLGLLCLFAIPYGYGTAVAIAIPVAVVGLVAGFKPEWRYGLVGAIALGIGAEGNLLEVATDRCLSIALGVVVGNLCALGIFPEKSSMRSERHLRLALKAIGDFLESAASRIDSREEADTSRPRREFGRHIAGARDSADGVNLAPDDGLREKIEWVDRLYTSVLFLKRVGERDAKQELGGGTGDKLARTAKSARELANRLAAGEGGAEGDLDSLAGQLGDLEDVVRRTPGEGTEMEQGTLAFAMKEVTDSMRKLAELYGLVRT